MLNEELQIDDYIRILDSAFPEFDRRICVVLRYLHGKWKRIIQVEPYLDGLLRIHDLFGDGKKLQDILRIPSLGSVYSVEKEVTAALLEYNAAGANQPFDTVIGKVRKFARSDARRLILRESIRAEAVAGLTCRRAGLCGSGQHSLFVQHAIATSTEFERQAEKGYYGAHRKTRERKITKNLCQ